MTDENNIVSMYKIREINTEKCSMNWNETEQKKSFFF